jgi:hypothetical protein
MGMGAIAAVACAALRFASELWASVMFTLALGFLCVAMLGALFSHASARRFWSGSALAGCLYLIIAFGPWCSTNVSPHLLTTNLLDQLHPRLQPSCPVGTGGVASQVKLWDATSGKQLLLPASDASGRVFSLAFSAHGNLVASQNCASCHSAATTAVGSTATVVVATREDFQRVGHSLSALFAALIGGLVACRFHRGRQDEPKPDGEQPCK